jgi:peptidyl-prolyl cis-trans isomerase D
MGIMTKLRDKTHIILIILVLAFIATIVFEWGMNYLGMKGEQGGTPLGSVNGKDIGVTDFESRVQFAVDQQKQQSGDDPDESVVQMIRDQVWDQMVTEILAQQEMERLGIKVTNQEILNWVYNSPQTLPDQIKRNFVDSTGQFNTAMYQQALATKTPEVTKFWSQVEDYLKQMLLSQKLQSVITSSVRVSEGDVMQKYKDENVSASFNYVFFDANSVPDAQIQVTDDELKAYYEKNKDDFKSEEGVKLKYVLFSDAPTLEDTTSTIKQLKGLTKELKKFDPKDSISVSFVNTNSAAKFEDKFVKPTELSPEVAAALFNMKKDSIPDVIKAQDGYHLIRLLDTKDTDQVFVNASHILISFGTDTNAAKVKADEIYKRIKAGEDFGTIASQLSDDPGSKVKNGNLGWFTKGSMVSEFENAAMTSNIGEVQAPVKSKFGFHIIKVLDRQKKLFKIADIKKLVKTSAKTKDAVRKRAEDFTFVTRKSNFDEETQKLNLKAVDVPPITKTSFVPGAGQNKAVTNFAFNEKKGNISDPIKIQGGYAVYLITEKIPAGFSNFEEIKVTAVTPKLRIEKKLDIIKQQAADMRARITGNDLNSLKTVNPQVNIQTADSFTVAKPNPSIGNDFDFNNIVFKLQNGQLSDPIRTAKGYYIVQMKSIIAFDQSKYAAQSDAIRTALVNQKKQSIVQEWITDLKDRATVVDNRDRFFR